MKKKIDYQRLLIPFISFACVSIMFCLPLFEKITNWGQMDWDEVFFWGGFARDTILNHHQFPLWNPYSQIEGGLVFIAHPNTYFLSPFFLLVLLLGPVYGVKLLIILHLAIGLMGMFLLSRYLNMNKLSSYLTSFIYMLNSMFFLHLTEGHFGWLTMAFLPWLFMSYLKSLKASKYILVSVLLLSLILLGGGVDVFIVTASFLAVFSFFLALQKRKISVLTNVVVIFVVTFLLCSVKLLPTLEYLSGYPRAVDSSVGVPPALLSTILLNRGQDQLYAKTKSHSSEHNKTAFGADLGVDYGWHEYGAYVGVIPLILFCLGAIIFFRKQWPLVMAGVVFLLFALGDKSPINLWGWMHSLPVYNSLRVPSRFILGFIFPFSLLAGFGISSIKIKYRAVSNVLLTLIAGIVLFDLWIVNGAMFKQAFIVPAPSKIKRSAVFSQYQDFDRYDLRMRGNRYFAFLSNKGVLRKIYNDLSVPGGEVMAKDNIHYRGEAYLNENNGDVSILYFSPNKVIVEANVRRDDILVLNQNFYKGWKVKGGEGRKVTPFKGLISTPVSAGKYRIAFYFLPNSFIIGCIVSIGTFLLMMYFFTKQRKAELLRGGGLESPINMGSF